MPGYCIHAAHGIKILELLENYQTEHKEDNRLLFHLKKLTNQKEQFMAGLLLPDAAKCAACSDSETLHLQSHYPVDPDAYLRMPDIEKFLKEHPLSPEHPVWIGYAAHLYLDLVFMQYLQGIITVKPASQNNGAVISRKVNGKTTEQNGDVFWKRIYDDYTALNRRLIQNYEIKIDLFPQVGQLDTAVDVRYIAWYANLYQEFSGILEKCSRQEFPDPVILQEEQINVLIAHAAQEFNRLYLLPLLSPKTQSTAKQVPYTFTRPENEDGKQWNAEAVKLKNYIQYWEQLVRSRKVPEIHKDFFQGVITEIEDVSRNAARHRKTHKAYTITLSVLPLISSIISGVAAALANNKNYTVVFTVLSIISASFGVVIALVTQLFKESADKEVWLRHLYYYSRLMNETESFCEGVDRYRKIEPAEAACLYMDEIRKLRLQDYSDFFANIGYGSKSGQGS